jgi:hypothetical protein
LIQYEMEWVSRFFEYQATRWLGHAQQSGDGLGPGFIAYAYRQNWMWASFRDGSREAFSMILDSSDVPSLDT